MVFGMFAQFLTRQTAGNESYIYLTSKIQIISLSHALKVGEHTAECMSFELFMLWATGQSFHGKLNAASYWMHYA